MAKKRDKPALLISNEASQCLKGSYCANSPADTKIKELLEKFDYDVKTFNEIKENYYQSNATKWIKENFRLVVVNLDNLDYELARVVPVVIVSGVPCAFVGDYPTNIPEETLAEMEEYFPEEVTKLMEQYSKAKIPFFGCCASFSALLDMRRRSNLYQVCAGIDHEKKEYIRNFIRTEMKNYLGSS